MATAVEREKMTSEMAFECLLAANDPMILGTMNRILQDLAIQTTICPHPSTFANQVTLGGTDLIVIDLESGYSSELPAKIAQSRLRKKPTILAISAEAIPVAPGVHIQMQKPVSPKAAAESMNAAYSRMLRDYREHARFAVMVPVIATDEENRSFPVTITNVGRGGACLLISRPTNVGGAVRTPGETAVVGSLLWFAIPLFGLQNPVRVRARILWTREYGAAGCEFVQITAGDLAVLSDWIESRYQIKKPHRAFLNRD
jgi:PilZ domain